LEKQRTGLAEESQPVGVLEKKIKNKMQKPQDCKEKHTHHDAKNHNRFTPITVGG
jgi:hypothetical protein